MFDTNFHRSSSIIDLSGANFPTITLLLRCNAAMPRYSKKDLTLIEELWKEKRYGSKRMLKEFPNKLKEFPNKPWNRTTLDELIRQTN